MPRMRMAIAMTGQIAGSTILKKMRQKRAPSSSAASSRERSTCDRAASRIRNMNGVHCQISQMKMAG